MKIDRCMSHLDVAFTEIEDTWCIHSRVWKRWCTYIQTSAIVLSSIENERRGENNVSRVDTLNIKYKPGSEFSILYFSRVARKSIKLREPRDRSVIAHSFTLNPSSPRISYTHISIYNYEEIVKELIQPPSAILISSPAQSHDPHQCTVNRDRGSAHARTLSKLRRPVAER